jgi:integrase
MGDFVVATYRKRLGKWQVQIRRKGQPAVSRSFTHKIDADCWVHDMERTAARGELARILNPSAKYSVGQLLKKYRNEVTAQKRGHGPETHVINAMLRQVFCDMRVSEVSPAGFTKYRDQRLKSVMGVTVKRELGILQHAFDIARDEWGWDVPSNPIKSIRKPASGKARNRRLMRGEETLLLTEVGKCQNPWIVPCVSLAIETAMRRSELLRMDWNDINWEKRTLHIPITKNGDPRTIPLTEDALLQLMGLPRSIDGRVIPISATCLRMAWDRALRRANIYDLRFHDLRHEAITRFFERGLTVPEVALISGHKDYRMLARYTHLRPEDVGKKLAGLISAK